MKWDSVFADSPGYSAFLERYGTTAHRDRWRRVHEQVALSDAQKALLSGFTRRMNVLCLAGAWCGDCVNQCPVFQRFAEASDTIDLRFLDRDAHPDVQKALSLCAGDRIPVVVFLSEDFAECGRYGERTLSKYRELARTTLGPSCPTGIGGVDQPLLAAVTQEWLNEFERIQLMLRLSPRLREKHHD
jgi:hypothetical protein